METKIYYHDKYVVLGQNAASQKSQYQPFKIFDAHDEKKLQKTIENFIKLSFGDNYILNGIGLKNFIDYFRDHHYYIEAAGGLVEKQNTFLLIHRLGRWDLPKGKLEKNESVEECAVRECEEECGVKHLRIIKPLSSTFHIYPYKKSYALKQSYWFYMKTDYDKPLVAQKEEHIDQVVWFAEDQVRTEVLPDTYFTIRDVLRQGLSMR